MPDTDEVQLARLVNANDPAAIAAEVERLFVLWYPPAFYQAVRLATTDVIDLFAGRFPGYRGFDTDYHDIHHTTSVLLTSARLLDGRALERGPYPPEVARDLLVAALCHDTGYIRTTEEEGGTGARFTSVHVARSAQFSRRYASRFGLDEAASARIARMVYATGLKGEYGEQEWAGSDEQEAGAALGSADLVGQMSDRAYLEKLLFLYYEFKEAGFPGYDTEFDILRKTLGFYEITIKRLDGELGGVRSLARRHFAARWGVDRDLCAEAMERQMDYLRGILADATTNFRKKLKRLDLEGEGHPQSA